MKFVDPIQGILFSFSFFSFNAIQGKSSELFCSAVAGGGKANLHNFYDEIFPFNTAPPNWTRYFTMQANNVKMSFENILIWIHKFTQWVWERNGFKDNLHYNL